MPVMCVCFINKNSLCAAPFPFGSADLITLPLTVLYNCYISHITSQNASKQVQTVSKAEYWKVLSISIPHKRGYVTTPVAGSMWKSHILKGQKK
jgi:hypothetical protein